jgi:tetratricopeptide (TPR) repeat protein
MALEDDTLSQVIDQIVERAAGAVLPAIDRDLTAHLPRGPAARQDSVTLYARARMEIRQARTLEAARAGAALLERIVADDPDHLGARLMLARLYNTDFWQQIAGHDVTELRRRADALVDEAVAIEPGNMAVKVRRAWCHIRNHGWRLAERDLEDAVAALPYDADLINECAFGYCHLGALELAEPLMQRAFRLNPFPPSDYHADYAVLLTLRGEAPAAEEHFAVSGEQGMQYLAVRLANLSRLGDLSLLNGDAARLETLRDTFARAFLIAWQAAWPAALDDVGRWIDYTLPFRRPEDAALIREGLLAALGPVFPARAADRNR